MNRRQFIKVSLSATAILVIPVELASLDIPKMFNYRELARANAAKWYQKCEDEVTIKIMAGVL